MTEKCGFMKNQNGKPFNNNSDDNATQFIDQSVRNENIGHLNDHGLHLQSLNTEKAIQNKLIIHPSFNETINDINSLNIRLPNKFASLDMDFQSFVFPPNGELLSVVEDIKPYDLDPKKGPAMMSGMNLAAYDESIVKFSALEGTAFLTSHSMVLLSELDYVPLNLLTLYFYTRSKQYIEKSNFIKFSNDPESDSKKDYVKDKLKLLLKHTPENSLLFIDGALIGGDHYVYTIQEIDEFEKKGIIPIYFIKNSSSNLVSDNISELQGKFNSDMHWAFNLLNSGQRSNFFVYADKKNKENAKVFCYLKSFNVSPQRIEMHVSTYKKIGKKIDDLMNLIYYLILVQGDKSNPQIRPIAIAEKYARETLHLIDLKEEMQGAGINPTMNQERFAW